MSIFSFSNEWKPFNKGFYYFLLVLALVLTCIYGYFLLIDDAITIPWILGSTVETIERPLTFINDSFINIPISGKHFLINEFYVAGDYEINSAWIYTFLALFWLCLMVLLAVCTFMSRTWYMLSMGIFILAIVAFQPTQVLLFGWTGHGTLILFLALFLIPSFLFNSIFKHYGLWLRLSVFLVISLVLALLINAFSEVSLPFYYLASYGFFSFLLISLVFVLLIAHEIVFGILFLSTYTKSNGRNLLNFCLLSFFYLGNLVLVHLKNKGTLDLDIIYVNTSILSIVSLVVGFWGFEKKEDLYRNILPFNPYGAFLYIALALVFLSFNLLIFYTGNDPVIEVMEDAISISHMAFGTFFFVYILVNFWKAIAQSLPVYRIAYQERNMPFFTANLAALIIGYILYSTGGSLGFYQSQGGYYNQLGDLYTKENKRFLADQYFLESSIWGFKNHKANYSLARIYLRDGKLEQAENAYEEGLKKKPSPQGYVNLAKLYDDQNKYFDALFTLKDGLNTFPGNQKIKNNLALQYAKTNFLDSAVYYLKGGEFDRIENNTSLINLSYIGTKYELPVDEDSLKTLIETSASQAVTSNLLAYKNTLFPGMPVNVDFKGNFSELNPHNASFLNNSLIHDIYTKDGNHDEMMTALEQALQNPANRSYNKDLGLLRGISAYYNGDISSAMMYADQERANRLSMRDDYSRLLSLWALEQGHYLLAENMATNDLELSDKNIRPYVILSMLNAGRLNVIPEDMISRIALEDSLKLAMPLAAYETSFASAMSSKEDSLRYLATKYRYKYQDIGIIKLLIEGITNQALKNLLLSEFVLWNINHGKTENAEALLAMADSSPLFEDYRKIAKVIEASYALPLSLTFSTPYYADLAKLSSMKNLEDSTTLELVHKIGSKTPFNTPQVLAATNILNKYDKDRAYQLLTYIGELNPFNMAIAKAYIKLALDQGFIDYAKDELERIEPYVSYEEYQTLRLTIDLKKPEDTNDDEW